METQLLNNRNFALFLLIGCTALSASAEQLQLVSAPDPSQDPPAGGSGDSWMPVLSPDGRYVLFASTANNLLLPSNNIPIPARIPANLNVFLRDRTNATTALVSANLTGVMGGNGDSLPVNVSTNGRYALFESSASDLVPGDTNNASDVFVRDLLTGATLLVSVSTNGSVGNGASYNSAMTPDGHYVAFVSAANNLVPGDTNRIPDVFVRDLQAGVTVLASVGAVSTNSVSPVGGSDSPEITPDGRYVAFYSTATNLVPGVPRGGDVYVRDLAGGNTIWASTGARALVQSVLHSANAVCFNYAISADGQFVAYGASAGSSVGLILRYGLGTGLTDLVHTNAAMGSAAYEDYSGQVMTPDGRFLAFVANTNGTLGDTTCVLVWDAQTGTITLASGDLTGQVPAGSTCDYPAIDSTGRLVAFLSDADGLVTNALTGDYHIYVRDLQSGSTTLVDADTNHVGSSVSLFSAPCLRADGRLVAFDCPDSSLVPDDSNQASDVFACDLATGAIELVSARHPSLPCLTPDGLSAIATTSVSSDGRYVAFYSEADNVAASDTNGCRDVFVRDTASGVNVLVSVDTNGFSGDGVSTDPAISPDGRFVAFTSSADNLVAGDINKAQDVFLRDLQTGTTTLISVNLSGTGSGNGDSYSPIVSSGGGYVLFRSKANNLATGVFASGAENLFLRDLNARTTYALSTTGTSGRPAAMTSDGRFTVFGAATYNNSFYDYLYVWDANAAMRIYTNILNGSSASLYSAAITPDGRRIVYSFPNYLYGADPVAKTNFLIESGSSGHQGLRLSGDGRWLVYSKAPTTGGTKQIYLYDLQARTNFVVSRNYDLSGPANGASDSPDISADGRFIAYRSAATNIVPGDVNGVPDIFVYDCLSGATMLLSASQFVTNSPADNRSLTPVFSADGQTLAFVSWASDLVAQDFNRWSDVFAYKLYASSGQIPLFSATVLPAAPGQTPWITWPVVSGKTYGVQFKNSLSDSDWQSLNGGVMVIGSQGYFKEPAPAPAQRFYRIVAY